MNSSIETSNDMTVVDQLIKVVKDNWGFESLRPLQQAAMEKVMEGRDSLLVLPTGGGKSLCYQAPAVLMGDTTVVISPLISLMKDQVDSLQANGIGAVGLNSSMTSDELREAEQAIRNGEIRLVFVSPEKMATGSFRSLLKEINVRRFAIDEAHCISHWGHDFRPEYRQLRDLKKLFPQASVHAYTATATQDVRDDIASQLGFDSSQVLVGSFDRPNLTYRVERRNNLLEQVKQCLERYKHEAGIIYCIRRRDVEELSKSLISSGIPALPYHAGMSAEQRIETQNAFIQEQCDLVVATVAFGMGIDRSNIRYVIHTGMPKSIEHYQQETGRAGRDGLEAECTLFYTGADAHLWRHMVEQSAAEATEELAEDFVANAMQHIEDMESYCRPITCRHKKLVEYFGQPYTDQSCQACDLCLDDAELLENSQVIAKKILSCVFRVNQNYGANHVIGVLRGENTQQIRQRDHNQLSTYGLLKGHSKIEIRDWIDQLIGQEVLMREGHEYPVLKLNHASWEVMKDQSEIQLRKTPGVEQSAKPKRGRKSKSAEVSWEGVDRNLFDSLRELRRELATKQGVPPYVIFNDHSLREMARVRPSTEEAMLLVSGVGKVKMKKFGAAFLKKIENYCSVEEVPQDIEYEQTEINETPFVYEESSTSRANVTKTEALQMFRDGSSIEEVIKATGRQSRTVVQYLCAMIQEDIPADISPWVNSVNYDRVKEAAEQIGFSRMKPIYVALDESVSYDEIAVVLAHLAALESYQ